MSALDRASLRRRRVLLALGAGALYGSWAALVNHGDGVAVALLAAMTQMTLSTTATLALELLIERLFRRARTPAHGFWLGSAGASAFAAAALASGHLAMGTPHIGKTIAPSVIVGTVFCFAYARTLLVRARPNPEAADSNAFADGSK